jgi:hypothetical protein
MQHTPTSRAIDVMLKRMKASKYLTCRWQSGSQTVYGGSSEELFVAAALVLALTASCAVSPKAYVQCIQSAERARDCKSLNMFAKMKFKLIDFYQSLETKVHDVCDSGCKIRVSVLLQIYNLCKHVQVVEIIKRELQSMVIKNDASSAFYPILFIVQLWMTYKWAVRGPTGVIYSLFLNLLASY